MKLFAIIIGGLLIASSCKEKPNLSLSTVNTITPCVIDTVMKLDTVYYKSDSLIHVIDSLKSKLFLANYKVEKVKFYVKIVDRKPNQIKFLKGWINRAVQ